MQDTDLYQQVILDELEHPQYKGRLPSPTHTLPAHNPGCGDTLTLFLTIKDNKIEALMWEGSGCAISTAAMSLLAAQVNRLHPSIEEVAAWTQKDLEQMLGITELSLGRVKCLMLGLGTLQHRLATEAGQTDSQVSPTGSEKIAC